jgi:ABC-type sugar transport system ATPase subunit
MMATKQSVALEMKSISKSFGNTIALQNVNLKVSRGSVHGLIGQNGAGKSTLMKILSGLYSHETYEGLIYVDGKQVKLKSALDAQAVGIAIVPQEITVAETLSVADNLLLPALNEGSSKIYRAGANLEKAKEILKDFNIALDPNALAATLTLVQKQILMIARALSLNPEVLVLDEPTSSLTGDEIENLFGVVQSLRGRGIATVFITHKMDEILTLCDFVSILRDGEVVFEGERSLFDADILVSQMIGRNLGDLYPQKNEIDLKSDVVFEVENLHVADPKRRGKALLEPFSFQLRRGEILGIGGLVGSGRTEILKTIFGEYRKLGGKISSGGNESTVKNIQDAIGNGIGYLTEDRKAEGLFFNLRVKQNLSASILHLLSRFDFLVKFLENRKVRDYVEKLKVKPQDSNAPVTSLSGGNQQKVVLGKSLITEPKILLLDEPTKGVDISSKAEIYRTMVNYAESGVSIVLVSSEFPELLAMSNRVLVFRNGKMIGEIEGKLENEKELMLMSIGGSK